MGVEAGLDCLADVDTKLIDGLYFATVSSPYKEKQAAALIASALDLRKDVFTSYFTGSLRAGTLAIKAAFDAVKAGTMQRVLVVAADTRRAAPRSDAEQVYGDGSGSAVNRGKRGRHCRDRRIFNVSRSHSRALDEGRGHISKGI
jgi:3-hydroxy-3-methylglutaryl CoA synthase